MTKQGERGGQRGEGKADVHSTRSPHVEGWKFTLYGIVIIRYKGGQNYLKSLSMASSFLSKIDNPKTKKGGGEEVGYICKYWLVEEEKRRGEAVPLVFGSKVVSKVG